MASPFDFGRTLLRLHHSIGVVMCGGCSNDAAGVERPNGRRALWRVSHKPDNKAMDVAAGV